MKKKFLFPPAEVTHLKDILYFARNEGIGRPLNKHGESVGPWTPSLLADEMAKLGSSIGTIDVRSIQNWFQDNGKGINSENIAKLATIFGCNDADGIIAWRRILQKANQQLKNSRAPKANDQESNREWYRPDKMATAVLHPEHSMSVTVFAWSFYAALGLLTFFYGAGSVTYLWEGHVEKQVGFFWAMHWTILPTIILPTYIFLTSRLLDSWQTSRIRLLSCLLDATNHSSWAAKTSSFALVFGSITVVSVFFVFLLQWLGVSTQYIRQGSSDNFAADWAVLSTIRPDLMTVNESVLLSFLGYLFTSIYIWIFLTALIFIYITSDDFSKILRSKVSGSDGGNIYEFLTAGRDLQNWYLRLSVVGIWFAICNRFHFRYLTSNSESPISWVVADFMNAVKLGDQTIEYVQLNHMNFFTTFLMCMVVVFVSSIAFIKISGELRLHLSRGLTDQILSRDEFRLEARKHDVRLLRFFLILILSVSGLLLIGSYTGFSIHLLIVVLASIATFLQVGEDSGGESIG